MNLRVLGCSGGIGLHRRTTSLLIDDDILIDSGSGVGDLTLEEMSRVRHIFLTHSHLDHFAFLPLLIDTMFPVIDNPIIIHGLDATLDALKNHIFNWHIWPDFARLPTAENPVMSYRTMRPGEIVDIDGRRLEMLEANHIIPCCGYRVETRRGVFAFSGDTTTNDSIWDALNAHDRLDLLLVEAAFPNVSEELSRAAKHYTPKMLAEDIRKLKHHPEIYISHPKPGHENTIFRECEAAMGDLSIKPLHGGESFKF